MADDATDRLGDRPDGSDGFDAFVQGDGARVRRALVAYYGLDVGSDAADDAMAVAWERWPQLSAMANPAGYVFRVGQSKARPHVRWRSRRGLFPVADPTTNDADSAAVVDLLRALGELPADQRAAVMLVKSFGYPHREVADLLNVSETAVNNMVHRGVQRLRGALEVSDDA